MRIGVDARPLCVPTFGIGRYTEALLARMIQAPGIEWFLYADRPLLGTWQQSNVTVRSSPSSNSLLSLMRTQLGFARHARADSLDVFWSPRHHLPLTLDPEIAAVVTIHDLVWQHFPETMLRKNLLVERLLMPPSVRKADALIAVSAATCTDLLAAWPEVADRTVVIHEAADPVDVSPTESETPYFVFLGTLEPRKNLPRLIAAFARALPDLPTGCRLKLIGATGWRTGIEAIVREHNVSAHVDIMGHVSDERLHATLAGAIALCLPSLYEGFGLPALEAMQHGTPVIGASVSSIPEIVGGGGVLIDPRNVDAIRDALMLMALDPARRQALSAEARQQAGLFSWDRAAAETLEVFRRFA